MPEFDNSFAEKWLTELDEQGQLFPQFSFVKVNNRLQLLGSGGFSSVYEMYNRERPENRYALKVIGLKKHLTGSAEFWNTARIQWILCRESNYVMRVLDAAEWILSVDEDGVIREVRKAEEEVWETAEKDLRLQFILMEKLDSLLTKDRFQKVSLLRPGLIEETEVLKLAMEIGQALQLAHNAHTLHRDVKLENMFWDEKAQVYKLGDFGIAKTVQDGNAETIVYTDGYGAPEIERRLYDSYHAAADIYSLGISLYLLLNDMKFPGSDGYYPKPEIQYQPDYVFPAPAHASVPMTRVIRKMCSFYAEDRYASMAEVLQDLIWVTEVRQTSSAEEFPELPDLETEVYKEEKSGGDEGIPEEERPKTRAERKEEQQIIDLIYREESAKYFLALTVLMTLMCKGLQPDASMGTNRIFWILPAAVMFEALLQKIKEFHLFFGILAAGLIGLSIFEVGLTVPHLLLLILMAVGCPVLTAAGATAVGIWTGISVGGYLRFLDILGTWDLGWLFLIAVLLVINRYFRMRVEWEKTTYIRAYLGVYVYDKMFPVMALLGILLWILQKCGWAVPEILQRFHLIRTGILSFAAVIGFFWWDGYLDEDEDAGSGEEAEESGNEADRDAEV